MYQPQTYIFAGGGTGGHLFPGMAVAAELCERNPLAEIVFIGSKRGIEREIVQRHNHRHEALPVEPSTTLKRNPLRFLWNNWQARNLALTLLNELSPAAVIGLGGFASVPVVLAARSQRIPTLLLEQNIVPGRATRWLSSRASRICVSFDETAKHLSSGANTRTTGNPVSRPIADLHRKFPTRSTDTAPTILILGGSQGATAVNKIAIGAIANLRRASSQVATTGVNGMLPVPIAEWTILHQTGATQHDDIAARYRSLGLSAETAPFFADMPERYAQATMAITRGGATSLAELAVAGVPAIIVPYPNSIGDHQRLNARYYESHGAANIVEQSDDAISTMSKSLSELAFDRDRLNAMGKAMSQLATPNATATVANEIERLAATSINDRKSA